MHLVTLCFLLWADAGYDQLLRDGMASLNAGDVEAARTSLERAVKTRPDGGEAWATLAQVYSKLNFAASARTAAGKAEVLARSQASVLRPLSEYYAIAGEMAKAADSAERYWSSKAATGDRDAIIRAVTFRLQAKQPKLAIALALKGLAAGDRADLRGLLAQAYEAAGETPRAINEYNRAILLEPYEESYYFALGQLLIDKQDFGTAAQVLEAGRKIFDKSAEIELALGGAYYGLHRYDDAAFAFLKAAALAPQAPQPYVFLGRVLDQSTKWLPEITTAFASFADAQPRQYLPQFLYGKALLLGGQDLKEAAARLRKAISLDDRFWESHLQLGMLLAKESNLPGAEQELKRSAALAPENPLPHTQLAGVYDHMGKPAEAKIQRALAEKLTLAMKPATGPARPPAKK